MLSDFYRMFGFTDKWYNDFKKLKKEEMIEQFMNLNIQYLKEKKEIEFLKNGIVKLRGGK